MDSTDFDRQYFATFQALETRLMTELWQAQHELQTLAKTLPAEADRLRAEEKILQLPTYFQSIFEPMSVERREAQLVLATADHTTGTKQERLAAIAATRRKIFEIADRAGDDAHRIRYMTRPLDCSERDIEDGSYYPWNDDYDPALAEQARKQPDQ
jgi:hypothetical protein